MAGGKTVGESDPTGMKQTMDVDKAAATGEKAKGVRKFMEYVPFSTARAAKKAREETRARLEEERRAKAKETEGREQQTPQEQRIDPNIDIKAIKGQDLTDFNNIFLDAIRRGYGRTEEGTSANSIIRRVVCNEKFIYAIANATIRTPHEELDTEYAKEMAKRRKNLAAILTKAAQHKEFIIGELSTHELDIIYTTMLGTPEEQPDEEPGMMRRWWKELKERRKEKHNVELPKPKMLGAVELWKNTDWPSDLPRPHEAFLMFLEAVAVRNYPTRKGEFIGNVLKDLSARTTFTPSNERPERKLVDAGYINEYLYSRSSYPIDRTVESFHSLITAVLNTPTNQMVPGLNVPGIGYDSGYNAALTEKKLWVDEARQKVAQAERVIKEAEDALAALQKANADLVTAMANVEAANAEVERINKIIQKAKAEGNVTLKDGRVLSADAPELQAALTSANKALQEAKEDEKKAQEALLVAEKEVKRTAPTVEPAKIEKANAEKEVARREEELAKFEREANPQALAMELAQHFKMLLENNREVNVDLEQVGERMKERLPNIVITKLVDQADKLTGPMEETAKIFHPEFIMEEQLRAVAARDAGQRAEATTGQTKQPVAGATGALQEPKAAKQAKLLVAPQADGGKEAPLLSGADVSIVSGEGATHAEKLIALAKVLREEDAARWLQDKMRKPFVKESEIFSYMKKSFDEDMAKLGADIETAEIPEEVKERLRTVHKCMSSLLYPADMEGNPRSIKAQLRKIREDYAYPLKQAGALAVRRLKEKSYSELGGISDADKIMARMTYEARTPEIPSPHARNEGKWRRFWNWVDDNIFTKKAWFSRNLDHPGYLVWLWRKSVGEPIDYLIHPSGWHIRDKRVTKKWGTYRKLPRWLRGAWGIAWRAYIAIPIIVGAAVTTKDWHWYNPLSWVGRPITMLAEKINGGPIYIPKSHDHWYFPWSLVMPVETEREIKRVIDDHYDIPERLSERGDDYYRQAYGVGTRRIMRVPQIPALSSAGESFYTRPENSAFNDFVEGIVSGLLEDQGNDGTLMRTVLERRFGNDTVSMKRAIKASVYDFLMAADATAKAQYGLQVMGQGDALTVAINLSDMQKARDSLRGHVRQLMMSLSDMETDDSGKAARLRWIKEHPDVLRFLQERITGRQVVQVRKLREVPENCSTRGAAPFGTQAPQPEQYYPEWAPVRLPNSCKNLGLGSEELVRDYMPVDPNDGWTPGRGLKVCCTIEISSRPLPDGLRLNTAMADQFIDMLMRSEKGGIRVDYNHLTRRENIGRWVNEWYLVPPAEADIITNFKIYDKDNVRFLNMQGANATRLLLPRCAEEARAPEFLPPEFRGLFVRAWIAEIIRSQAELPIPVTVDPLMNELSSEVLEQSFNAVKQAHSEWFIDRTHEYKRLQVREEVREFDLQTDTAVDVLVAQPDILELVMQFKAPARYGIVPSRSDEFVQVLDQHKRMGGNLEDFNPFSTSEGAGTRVRWAVNMGYIHDREIFSGAEQSQTREGSTVTPTQGQAQIPTLTSAGERFYARSENDSFENFVEGVCRMLLEDRGNDGRLMHTVLERRFGNDPNRLERAVKANIYDFLTSTRAPDVTMRAGYGLQISGEGDTLTVTVTNMIRARESLKNHIRQFVVGLIAQQPPVSGGNR